MKKHKASDNIVKHTHANTFTLFGFIVLFFLAINPHKFK